MLGCAFKLKTKFCSTKIYVRLYLVAIEIGGNPRVLGRVCVRYNEVSAHFMPTGCRNCIAARHCECFASDMSPVKCALTHGKLNKTTACYTHGNQDAWIVGRYYIVGNSRVCDCRYFTSTMSLSMVLS